MENYIFYTRQEAAEILQATPRQIERWCAQKRLGCVRMGNRTLHTSAQIEAFVAASTREAVAS